MAQFDPSVSVQQETCHAEDISTTGKDWCSTVTQALPCIHEAFDHERRPPNLTGPNRTLFELDEMPSDVKTAGRHVQWHTVLVPPFDFGHVRNSDEQCCNCAAAPGYRACYA